MSNTSSAPNGLATKKPARVADQEIGHLEAVLGAKSREYALTAVKGLDVAYWTVRLNAVRTHYDLLPSQKARISGLQRMLLSLDPESDGAASVQKRVAWRAAA